MGSDKRVFLFLQGPAGTFFQRLGAALKRRGHAVIRVNLNGGDFLDWPRPDAVSYRGRHVNWPAWIGRLLRERKVTDVFMLSEWRPFHIETVELAKAMDIAVHVFEDGYLRPGYVTLERNGVNGASPLPRDPDLIMRLAAELQEPPAPQKLPSHSKQLTRRTVLYLVARYGLFPLYPFSRTHRPYSGFSEYVLGWLPRLAGEKKRQARAAAALDALRASGRPFFLFPLQVNADAQVRRYSPFGCVTEAICHIMTSFARSAPEECALLIKNHPLDCGLVNYARYIESQAEALGLAGRVFFVEAGDGARMIENSRGLVLLNSTMGLSALRSGKPVYYLGRAICSIPGLGVTPEEMSLAEYWRNPRFPDPELLRAFSLLLRGRVLLNGDFLTPLGQDLAIQGVLERIGA